VINFEQVDLNHVFEYIKEIRLNGLFLTFGFKFVRDHS